MTKRRHGPAAASVTEDAAELARDMGRQSRAGASTDHPSRGPGNALTLLISAAALIFSAVSLYETVLRQPDLSVHIPPVIHYTRESGGEILALPVTIANRGARPGTVVSIELTGTSNQRPDVKTFYSAHFVGPEYFLRSQLRRSATGGLQITKQRPKLPFAPLSIEGRSDYSGTILFAAKSAEFPLLVGDDGEVQFALMMTTQVDARWGWLDRLLAHDLEPVRFAVTVKNLNRRTVERGDTVALRRVGW